jgi:glycosyltransferase involved in cell wall biosynthesis
MRILLVAMNSIHFVRWTDQLKDSGHEVFWFDILDGGKTDRLPWVNQITGWKQKYPYFKGRHFIKKHLPVLYKKLGFLIENSITVKFEEILYEIKPDLVHSFVLYISCTPILEVMKKHHNLPWVYSSWGSDLYYFKNIPKFKRDILKVLTHVNYLITDCKRDIKIAKELGFNGKVLGTFPGGGGFNYDEANKYIKPVSERQTILVKGYQGRSGRAIEILNALKLISDLIEEYKIVVFGTDKEVENYLQEENISSLLTIKSFPKRDFLPHQKILELMGNALVYIGNSNSDGMPNSLLEAIIQGAFPIQSNPGGASAEVIEHHKNGLLIEDCEDPKEIAQHIKTAISNVELLKNAFQINQNHIKPKYERQFIKIQVLDAYKTALKS